MKTLINADGTFTHRCGDKVLIENPMEKAKELKIGPCKVCGYNARLIVNMDSVQIVCDNGKHWTPWFLRYTPWGDFLSWETDVTKAWNEGLVYNKADFQ